MKIVKFKDGSYGIRRGWLFGYEYKDLRGSFWWRISETYFIDCKGTKEQVMKFYRNKNDKGTVLSLADLVNESDNKKLTLMIFYERENERLKTDVEAYKCLLKQAQDALLKHLPKKKGKKK